MEVDKYEGENQRQKKLNSEVFILPLFIDLFSYLFSFYFFRWVDILMWSESI